MALLHDITASSLRISRASRTLCRCRLFGRAAFAGFIQGALDGLEDQERRGVAMGVILDGLQEAQVRPAAVGALAALLEHPAHGGGDRAELRLARADDLA